MRNWHVIPNPSCLSHVLNLMLLLLSKEPPRHGRSGAHDHLRGGKAPEVGPGRYGPITSSGPHGGGGDDVLLVNDTVMILGLLGGGAEAFSEQERGWRGRGGGGVGGGAVEVGGGGGERRRCGAGSGGGDDGRLSLTEEPLDGLAIGLVTEFTCQLKHTCRADDWHPYPPPTAVHLAVPVLRWRLLHRYRRPHRRLPVGGVLDDCAVCYSTAAAAVSSSVCSRHGCWKLKLQGKRENFFFTFFGILFLIFWFGPHKNEK